jgi:hypothetical protein
MTLAKCAQMANAEVLVDAVLAASRKRTITSGST